MGLWVNMGKEGPLVTSASATTRTLWKDRRDIGQWTGSGLVYSWSKTVTNGSIEKVHVHILSGKEEVWDTGFRTVKCLFMWSTLQDSAHFSHMTKMKVSHDWWPIQLHVVHGLPQCQDPQWTDVVLINALGPSATANFMRCWSESLWFYFQDFDFSSK